MQQTNTTFGNQHLLPRLPVPELNETCDRYLRWLKPLLNETDWLNTQKVVEDFKIPEGEGEKLQARLLEWSKQPEPASWLEPFWDAKYLTSRVPLPVNVNFSTVCKEHPKLLELSQIKRSAYLIHISLRFKDLIDRGELEVDRNKDAPLCMMQFKKLFATTRIPKRESDFLRSAGSENSPPSISPLHIIVLHRGHIFKLECRTESGEIKSIGEFEQDLDSILSSAKETVSDDAAPAILTTLDRDAWAEAREALINLNTENNRSLEAIETALFALCLDKSGPVGLNERFQNILHGDGKNRWFDKSFQFIVGKNGKFGVNGEHSGLDGYPVHRLIKFIYDESENQDLLIANKDALSANRRPSHRLAFHLNNPLREIIGDAFLRFDALKKDTLSHVIEYRVFGKERIKTFRVSPDAFMQLALQLAQYELYGECRSIYEVASTRQFLHGRTETLRSVSAESLQFVKNMLSKTCDDNTKASSLRRAAQKHVTRMKTCMAGKGVERHLLGLLSIYERFGKDLGILNEPEIFKDKGWRTLRHDTFSTTSNPDPHGVVLSGFGPVVDDGFGICYTIIEDCITITVTARSGMKSLLSQFTENLTASLTEMSNLMISQP